MASFPAKIGCKRLRNGKNKNYRYVPFQPKEKQKIKKKIKKYHLLHFWQKFVGKCREREKINIMDPFRSYPTRNRKSQKNSKKIQKIEKDHYSFIPSPNSLEKAEKERK